MAGRRKGPPRASKPAPEAAPASGAAVRGPLPPPPSPPPDSPPLPVAPPPSLPFEQLNLSIVQFISAIIFFVFLGRWSFKFSRAVPALGESNNTPSRVRGTGPISATALHRRAPAAPPESPVIRIEGMAVEVSVEEVSTPE